MTHNFRELGLDAGAIDALALSHGHADHFGGLLGFLSAYRRRMRPGLRFYGHPNHYVARWMERDGDRVSLGRLDRGDVARWDVDVVDVPEPVVLAEGVLLSGEMRATEPYEAIPPSLRMEQDGALVQDTFIGEQTLVAHVRDRGLVVVTSCSHRGIVGICRNATRVSGVPKIHAVLGRLPPLRPRRRADRPGGRGAARLRGRLPRAPALHRLRGVRPARPADGEGAGRELHRLDVHVRGVARGAMAELPVACTLSEPELAARRAGVLAAIRRDQQEARWLPDGVALRFAAAPDRLATLATFIDLERRCCAFLRFRLTVEPGGGPIWLELTGPPGTREFLAAELAPRPAAPERGDRGSRPPRAASRREELPGDVRAAELDRRADEHRLALADLASRSTG